MAENEGTEWFWRIVDQNGIADVPSDEEAALRLILTRLTGYERLFAKVSEDFRAATGVGLRRASDGADEVILRYRNREAAIETYSRLGRLREADARGFTVEPA